MALNGFNLLSCFFLLLMLFSNVQAKRDTPKYTKETSSKYIHYLQKFGYLDKNPSLTDSNDFDVALEAAVKTYQTNFHLNPTGEIDDETVAMMMMPRCGVADIINGTNFMRAKIKKESSLRSLHIVAHYTLTGVRWPTMALTYSFLPNVPSNVVEPVERAFGRWASATLFTFSKVDNVMYNANLVIGWFTGDHGDGSPFDGPGGVLAHAGANPPTGILHYDADEKWSVEQQQDAFHLETIATHEIGHLLGLGHSYDPAAIMYPSINPGMVKGLNADDIYGIKAIYNY